MLCRCAAAIPSTLSRMKHRSNFSRKRMTHRSSCLDRTARSVLTIWSLVECLSIRFVCADKVGVGCSNNADGFQVLDMIELGVTAYLPLEAIETPKCNAGSKPCLMFQGAAFEQKEEFIHLKSLFVDFFRGPVVEGLSLQGIDHIISITIDEEEKVCGPRCLPF